MYACAWYIWMGLRSFFETPKNFIVDLFFIISGARSPTLLSEGLGLRGIIHNSALRQAFYSFISVASSWILVQFFPACLAAYNAISERWSRASTVSVCNASWID